MLYGALQPESLGSEWRRWPLVMEGNCKYIEQAVADGCQRVVFQLGGWVRG